MMDSLYWEMEPNKEPAFDPQLRKATPLMKVIIDGIKSVFALADSVELDSQTQLILSSAHGELVPTYEYLRDCAIKNWARPFLFQNSLHHSTTGFISQYFQLTGPAYSLCGIDSPEECALSLGLSDMMKTKKPTLFVHAEYFPEELVPVSDFEAIRKCHILYVGNQGVIWQPKMMEAKSRKSDGEEHIFKKIAKAIEKQERNFQVDFAKGSSFQIEFQYM